ncbi:MAG: SDR family oxidoreductase [Candidatus Aminicenantes bacterium]|nr:SDR family oxidoreductase [Candidatus Aminicenantes bacterium]
MADFSNKVVLVTGASRGIGRAVAVAFAKRGAGVAVHYNRNAKAAEETLSFLAGSGHMKIGADIGDPDAVKDMVDGVAKRMGRIDVLVNNAGIYEEHPLFDMDFESWKDAWRRTIDVNLLGSAHASYCAARHMKKSGGGRIINITSRGAFRGEPTAPAYGASKAGQNAMSQSLAKALAPEHIYVYAVAPGWVETDMAAPHLAGPDGDSIRGQSPMNRVAAPEEVADCVVFLASDGHDYMSGAIIDINGASYLRS